MYKPSNQSINIKNRQSSDGGSRIDSHNTLKPDIDLIKKTKNPVMNSYNEGNNKQQPSLLISKKRRTGDEDMVAPRFQDSNKYNNTRGRADKYDSQPD